MMTPLGIWIALSIVAQWWSSSLLSFLLWVRTFRWISYICGLVLCLVHFTSVHFLYDLSYANAVLVLSVGLSIPLKWLAGGPGAGGPGINPEEGQAGGPVINRKEHP